jgi:hypothetical protein
LLQLCPSSQLKNRLKPGLGPNFEQEFLEPKSKFLHHWHNYQAVTALNQFVLVFALQLSR